MSADYLHIKVIEARNLAAMDFGGTSDPYCRVKNNFNKQQFKTKIVDKTLNPKWGEEFKMFNPPLDGKLMILLWDHDTFTSDDFLGEVEVDLRPYSDGQPHDVWLQLVKEPKKKAHAAKGELRLELTFMGVKAPSTTPSPATTRKVEDVYNMGRELGRGGFAIVYEARKKDGNQAVAIKVINKSTNAEGGAADLAALNREIEVMSKLKHPNIIELIDVFDTANELYIVMELVTGGELFDKIQQKGTYSEAEAVDLVKQVLSAIQFMHSHGIAHRDLKPENLLCAGQSREHAEVIKIADFGLAKEFSSSDLKTCVGSPIYVAPEILSGEAYDCAVDLWSIGVITYILLCGFPPFYSENQSKLFDLILDGKLTFPSPEWDIVSPAAKDFVKALIVTQSTKRMTAEAALKHQWITSGGNDGGVDKKKLINFISFRDGANIVKKK